MAQFMPGGPRGSPTAAEASAALETLARLHVAAASLPGKRVGPAIPVCLVRRIEQAQAMLERPWRGRRDALGGRGDPEILARLDHAVSIFDRADGERMLRRLAAVTPRPMHVQPVLRDIWSDHVFFDDAGRVAAIIDFHAAGIDSPATDLARLLGSWKATAASDGTLLDRWHQAVAAYEGVRRLDDAERRLVPLLHAAGVVCGLDNWFRWTLDEQRSFPDRGRVHARIDLLLAGLEIEIAEAVNALANLD
jgi:Ser/Thr protein kinase RdoA (MazF antagonist)